jgi:hypothetical protein
MRESDRPDGATQKARCWTTMSRFGRVQSIGAQNRVMTKSRSDGSCGSQKGCSCRSPLAVGAGPVRRASSRSRSSSTIKFPGAGVTDLLPERASERTSQGLTAHSSTAGMLASDLDAAVAIFTQRWTHGASCPGPSRGKARLFGRTHGDHRGVRSRRSSTRYAPPPTYMMAIELTITRRRST